MSYRNRSVAKVLEGAEREKKGKYVRACLDRRMHFTLFVCSVDGELGREAKALIKRLASALAGKWYKPYGTVVVFVRARLGLALV